MSFQPNILQYLLGHRSFLGIFQIGFRHFLSQISAEEFSESTVVVQELFIGPRLGDNTVDHNRDTVGLREETDAMGDENAGFIAEEAVWTDYIVEDVFSSARKKHGSLTNL